MRKFWARLIRCINEFLVLYRKSGLRFSRRARLIGMVLFEATLVTANVQSLSAATTFHWQMALVQPVVKTDCISTFCARNSTFQPLGHFDGQ
jgi:hypothetical protein